MARAARPGRRPATGAAVPVSFRTDETWIWTDAVAYYRSRHGTAPGARLRAHIDAECPTGQDVPAADHDTVVRAADSLLGPPTGQACKAVWFLPRRTPPT